jgi:hypothetical protein
MKYVSAPEINAINEVYLSTRNKCNKGSMFSVANTTKEVCLSTKETQLKVCLYQK